MNIKLKRARIESGLTQLKIAEQANISVRYYQRLEAGFSKPTVDVAKRIAQILNSTVDELF